MVAPPTPAEAAITAIAQRWGRFSWLSTLARAEARRAVRERRVLGFREDRAMGGGTVWVFDLSRGERDVDAAVVLPPPARLDATFVEALCDNPWESIAEVVTWFESTGLIAHADRPDR